MALILDDIIHAEFRDLLGPKQSADWIATFLGTLAVNPMATDADVTDRDRAFQTAHRIVGRAGLVGCVELVEACIDLQHACKSGADIAEPYSEMTCAVRNADRALREAMATPA